MKRQWVFIGLLGSLAAAQAADVYKWVDANGVVHYSASAPPSEVKAQVVHLNGTGSTAAAPAAIQADAANTQDPGKPAAAPNTVASAVQSAEKRCANARGNLEVLQRSGPVAIDTGGKSTPKALDDKERQRQITGAQTIIATYCK